MNTNSNEELEQMKRAISLIDFLAHRRYSIDTGRSYSDSKVMVCGEDKVTVGKANDGNWVWIGKRGAGSIFDYLKKSRRADIVLLHNTLDRFLFWIGGFSWCFRHTITRCLYFYWLYVIIRP